MQQPPAEEYPHTQPKSSSSQKYMQRPLAPLQSPSGPPPQPSYPEISPPLAPSLPASHKKSSKHSGKTLILVMSLCLCFIALYWTVQQNTQQQLTASDDNSPVIIATMPPEPKNTHHPMALIPPTPPPGWVTTHIFEGNGNRKTPAFQTGDTWKLAWSCGAGITSENMTIDVHFSDGSMLDYAAVSTVCEVGNTQGETLEYQGGLVYLDIASGGGWSVKIQELQ